jgi:hypothetical protein
MFIPTSVSVLPDVVVFLSSTVVLTPNDNFWIVPLLHSVSDVIAVSYNVSIVCIFEKF